MITDLASYDVDPVRGFLPAQDPLTQLPAPFAEWDRLAAELPALILTGRVRRRLEQLQTPDLAYLEDSAQLERAMLVISALGMAYVWGMEPPARRIPAASSNTAPGSSGSAKLLTPTPGPPSRSPRGGGLLFFSLS